ncbi:hypothetical protein [Bosea sp. BH3]|uniref:hypothetical protein n=1 Tax=Bosea sp. BH3 TaxID=2871701 RepID=UPI0021CB61D2|nr:hypothetical protein [Bosea sp. BH3]MCU4182383.1 hypothetical protein [Bosea sp. BH3]
MTHRYRIRDRVSLAFGFHDRDAAGTYEVTALLPTRADGEPQYRIRGSDDRERVIAETQISEPGKIQSASRQRSPDNPITKELDRIRDQQK